MTRNYREADVGSQLESLREENSRLRDELALAEKPKAAQELHRRPIPGGVRIAGRVGVYMVKQLWAPEVIGGLIVLSALGAALFGLVNLINTLF